MVEFSRVHAPRGGHRNPLPYWPLVILMGAVFAIWYLKPIFCPAYNTDNPDYLWLTKSLDEDVIDLARLNGGNWKVACVFGGYSDPVGTMAEMQASVGSLDALRLWNYRGFPVRLGTVEEEEAAIAYVDRDSRAHFIFVQDGNVDLQHFSKCIEKPQTLMPLTS